jgi:hypothetical protein
MVGVENGFDELVRSADLDMQSASRSMLHDCIDAVHICQHRRRDHLLRTTARKQVALAVDRLERTVECACHAGAELRISSTVGAAQPGTLRWCWNGYRQS